GLLGGMGGAIGYLLLKRFEVWIWLDRLCLPLGLGYAIGRIGCFLNGCCYGKICEFPWAISFPAHANWGMAMLPRHPTQLYAVILEFLIVYGLMTLEKLKFFRKSGQLAAIWLIAHGINRLIMEHWRDDERGSLIF